MVPIEGVPTRVARGLWLAAATLAALWAPAARAQDRAVYPGDRVRVTTMTRWTGMVQAVREDTLFVVPDGERVARPLAVAGVERLELSLGEKSRGRPFLIGGLAGGALGAGTAALLSAHHTCDVSPDRFGTIPFCEKVGPVAIVASTLAGFALGGAIGALLGNGERWVRAVLPATR